MKTSSLASSLLLAVGVVVASPTVASAGGPPMPVFQENPAFLCEGEADLPPSHCINGKGKGSTGVILVFAPDPRGPQESYSTDPRADARPCPHDPGADADGTWWSPAPGLYVCHHRP